MDRLFLPRATLAIVLLAQLLAGGCEQETGPQRVALVGDLPLYAPTELVRTPAGDLVALVAEGEQHALALYRSGPAGQNWARWLLLPAPGDIGEVDMAAGGNRIAVAGAWGGGIWFASLLADPAAPEDSVVCTLDLRAEDAVVSLALAAAAPHSDSMPQVHLTYLTGEPEDTLRTMHHTWSVDGGQHWTDPTTITDGTLGRVALDVLPKGSGSADMVFSRDRFIHWRGFAGPDRTEEVRAALQVAHTSRNEIARQGWNLLAIGESPRNQVVATSSDNAGRNWTTAIALASDADHRRRPDCDAGFGLFWVAYCSGDTTLTVRAAVKPARPQNWSRGIFLHDLHCMGEPSIVALPDSSAGVLYAVPDGQVYFTRVGLPQ